MKNDKVCLPFLILHFVFNVFDFLKRRMKKSKISPHFFIAHGFSIRFTGSSGCLYNFILKQATEPYLPKLVHRFLTKKTTG